MTGIDADGLASALLRAAKDRNVVVGPPLWHPDGGAYFIVARGRRRRSFVADQVKAAPNGDICRIRAALLAAFSSRPAIRVHDMDGESETIARCEELWPCPQIAAVRRAYEMEKTALRLAARPN